MNPIVRKTVNVAAPQETAFTAFTQHMTEWWPLESYHIGQAAAASAVVEPRTDGRWFERGVNGTESDWGRVLVWDPPHRLVLSWEITWDWKHDENLSTEVEVRFLPLDEKCTRVELEHRKLEQYKGAAEEMKAIFDSPDGWARLLGCYAQFVPNMHRTH